MEIWSGDVIRVSGSFSKFQINGKNESGEEEIVIIRGLLQDSGALEFSTKLCEEYLWKAKNIILSLNIKPYTQQVLLGLINYLGDRTYHSRELLFVLVFCGE